MNQHIPDREPERRPLPGPFRESDVIDALQRYADELADFELRYGLDHDAAGNEAELARLIDDDGEHGASDTIRRWEQERMVGIE